MSDSNPFKLTDGQQSALRTGAPKYVDMTSTDDIVTQLGINAAFRTRRVRGRRTRFGFGIGADVYGQNTDRTRVAFDVFLAQSFSKQDELKLKVGFDPSAFRRNYVDGIDGIGVETFGDGDVRNTALRLSYHRELYNGKGTGLGVKLAGSRTWTSVDNMTWRDHVDTGGEVKVDAQFSKAVDLELDFELRNASYDGVPEPVVATGTLQMLTFNRDRTDATVGAELGIDLSKAAKVYFGYVRRNRDFDASLGQDARYGGRTDTRDSFSVRLRLEPSKQLDVWLGGTYRAQDTNRPASGATGDVVDYDQGRVSLKLVYSR